jgi:hypothetical protein
MPGCKFFTIQEETKKLSISVQEKIKLTLISDVSGIESPSHE